MTLTKAIIKIADSIIPAIGKQSTNLANVREKTKDLCYWDEQELAEAQDCLMAAMKILEEVRDAHKEELRHRNPQPL